MDDADRALQTINDFELGPVEPVLVEQIPKAHLAACHNLAIEYDRCLSVCGPLVTYQRLHALQRRCERLMDN